MFDNFINGFLFGSMSVLLLWYVFDYRKILRILEDFDHLRGYKRLNLLISPPLLRDMRYLQNKTGLSDDEIFYRAMALYRVSYETKEEGGSVILKNSDGTIRENVGFATLPVNR
jgi:hypothetical protein